MQDEVARIMVDFAKEPPFWLVSILLLCNPVMKHPYLRNTANNRLHGYDMVSFRFVFSEVAALKAGHIDGAGAYLMSSILYVIDGKGRITVIYR